MARARQETRLDRPRSHKCDHCDFQNYKKKQFTLGDKTNDKFLYGYVRDRNLLFGIRWGIDRYDTQRLCGGYSSGLRGVAMSFMYSNFPLYGNGVWVFGTLNKQTEFLFYVEYGDLYYLDTINNKYEMVTYFEDFSEFELHFLKRTLQKFNLYHGEYL